MLNPENIKLIVSDKTEFPQEASEKTGDSKTPEIEAIEAWREFLTALLPYSELSAEMCIKNIAKTVMQKISSYVDKENMFTINDEKVFWHYAGIMERYAQTSAVYNESLSEIKDLRIQEILNGISEILTAQLKSYEEHVGRTSVGHPLKNPIAEEKEGIIRTVLESVECALKAVFENIVSDRGYFEKKELRAFCAACADRNVNESHIDFFNFMYQRVIEKGGLDIYKSYSGAIMECKNMVNSLHLRKETRFFCDALKQEKENLDSIIKIQVAALTNELNKEGSGVSDRFTVERIIEYLAETRDIAVIESEELDRLFAEAEVKMPVLMNYDDFLSFIEEKGLCAYSDRLRDEGLETGVLSAVQLWKEKLDRFILKLQGFAGGYATPSGDEMPLKRFLYETHLRITDKLILTDEMLKGVRELARFYEENVARLRESVPDEHMKIIDGIHETVAIKIDVLTEGREHFKVETAEKLASICPPELSGEDEKYVFTSRYGIWLDEMIDADIDSPDFENEARNAIPRIIKRINELGNPEEYQAKLDRKISCEEDRIVKIEASYLRDCLLFEIITFEEILAYSVSKLKESGNTAAAEYAARCDGLAETLIKLCKLHNILIISPKPYDTFNSSEHEVLVAEKNDGYKKGQIIKLMNSGFKYNEAVLVRANVIAAK